MNTMVSLIMAGPHPRTSVVENGELREARAEAWSCVKAILIFSTLAALTGVTGFASAMMGSSIAPFLTITCLVLLFYSAHSMDRLAQARKQIKAIEYNFASECDPSPVTR